MKPVGNYRSILGYVQAEQDPTLDGIARFFDYLPVGILIVVLVSLAFVSFRDAGATLVGLGALLLYMAGVNASQYTGTPLGLTGEIPRPMKTWGSTGLAALVLGGLLNWLHPAPQPVAVATPAVKAVTAQHVTVDLPCRSIRTQVVPVDGSLRAFSATSRCATASGTERHQNIDAASVGLGVGVLELAYAGDPTDIHVELRNVPRAAVFETALAENLVRQPFQHTESLVWDIKDSNRVAFSFLAPWLAPAHAALPGPIDFFMNLRELGWGWGIVAGVLAIGGFLFKDRIVKAIGDSLLAIFGRLRGKKAA